MLVGPDKNGSLNQLYLTGFHGAEIVESDPNTATKQRITFQKFKRHNPFDSLSTHLGYSI